jgi:hypothetical protein
VSFQEDLFFSAVYEQRSRLRGRLSEQPMPTCLYSPSCLEEEVFSESEHSPGPMGI